MIQGIIYLQGPTELLNPKYDKSIIAAAYEDDPEAARAEYGGQFRSDVSGYLSDEVIERALCPGDYSRPRALRFDYVGFVDPAGGVSGGDEMTVAVAHADIGGRVVLDQLHAVTPPFDTEKAVESCALILKSFGISSAKADRYAGLWPAQSFARHGITLNPSDLDKSAIYREVAPLFVSGLVSLLDDPRTEVQLRSLERTPKTGGKPDGIDHPPGRGSSDDRINAACGALLLAAKHPWSGRSAEAMGRRGQHLRSADVDPFPDPQGERTTQPANQVLRDGWGRVVHDYD